MPDRIEYRVCDDLLDADFLRILDIPEERTGSPLIRDDHNRCSVLQNRTGSGIDVTRIKTQHEINSRLNSSNNEIGIERIYAHRKFCCCFRNLNRSYNLIDVAIHCSAKIDDVRALLLKLAYLFRQTLFRHCGCASDLCHHLHAAVSADLYSTYLKCRCCVSLVLFQVRTGILSHLC